MKTLMVTQTKLHNDKTFRSNVISQVIPDPDQSKKMHQKFQKLMNDPTKLHELHEQSQTSGWNNNYNNKSNY